MSWKRKLRRLRKIAKKARKLSRFPAHTLQHKVGTAALKRVKSTVKKAARAGLPIAPKAATRLARKAAKRAGYGKVTGRLAKKLVRKDRKIKARRAFGKWLKKNDPFLYRVGVKRSELIRGRKYPQKGLAGYDFDESLSGGWEDLTGTLNTLIPTLAQAAYQKKLLKIQMQRAEKGLPPLKTEDYSPAIKIAPQITPETEQAITRVAKDSLTSGLSKLAIPAVLGGVALLLILKKKRR